MLRPIFEDRFHRPCQSQIAFALHQKHVIGDTLCQEDSWLPLWITFVLSCITNEAHDRFCKLTQATSIHMSSNKLVGRHPCSYSKSISDPASMYESPWKQRMPNFISPGQKRPLTTQTVQNVTPRRPHTTTRVTSKHNKGKETNRGIHISSNIYMYTSAKHTFGFDTSHHHSSPNNSRVKNKKCKTGITDMMQTEKGCRWITLLSLFFKAGIHPNHLRHFDG